LLRIEQNEYLDHEYWYGYFLIAADSENSMRQIRKQIRFPELHTYHILHNLLETIIKAIRNIATLSI